MNRRFARTYRMLRYAAAVGIRRNLLVVGLASLVVGAATVPAMAAIAHGPTKLINVYTGPGGECHTVKGTTNTTNDRGEGRTYNSEYNGSTCASGWSDADPGHLGILTYLVRHDGVLCDTSNGGKYFYNTEAAWAVYGYANYTSSCGAGPFRGVAYGRGWDETGTYHSNISYAPYL